ncbi:uncharacterized protein LOC129961552 isoform X2 [Argiope bruennichi]|uniref:Uncharacterized protein n=2 Tax=Argiope bruennichi TaxID=94029 RepID=A0A8T0FSV4_ARGBR|nr:uncharacterized protein LOC129961552 isoform X2 [Argiope bruennichi]KAF8794234.1 hypothetical protein HNY73_002233 [Argiope bruennichi]
MEGLTRDCSDSFESDLSSDGDPKSPHDYLSFFSKITDDLRIHFARNSSKEDYCEDIYEDIYSSPVSGSYSYYKDLVAVAQEADARKDCQQKRSRFEFHEQPASTFSEFLCPSACTGHFNPAVGTGPFEELFQVLKPTPQLCCSQTPGTFPCANTTTHWSQNVESMGTASNEIYGNSLNDEYSDFIDILHRWTSDDFSTEFPPCDPNDF